MRTSLLLLIYFTAAVVAEIEIEEHALQLGLAAVACFTAGCVAFGSRPKTNWFGGTASFFFGIVSSIGAAGYQSGFLKTSSGSKRSLHDVARINDAKPAFMEKVKSSPYSTAYWEALYDGLAHGEDFEMLFDDGTPLKFQRGNGKMKVSTTVFTSASTGRFSGRDDSYELQAFYDEKVEFGYDYDSNYQDWANAVADRLSSETDTAYCGLLQDDADEGQYAYLALQVDDGSDQLDGEYDCESYSY